MYKNTSAHKLSELFKATNSGLTNQKQLVGEKKVDPENAMPTIKYEDGSISEVSRWGAAKSAALNIYTNTNYIGVYDC